jgi:LysR family transcriptional regulator, hydrogen peroxide-inducible genes activator
MTLQELRYLVAVADEGHFARAAETCHVSQSTLSIQLKKLEDYLGVVLLDRSQRHVAVTPIGEQIIARARRVLEEIANIREVAGGAEDPMAGTLQLGVIPTLGPYLFPHLLPAIHTAYPQLKLLLREDLTAHLLAQLRGGKLDAALLATPVPSDGLDVETLFTEPFLLALPAGHRLARRKRIQPTDLAGENLLLLEEGHCLRDQALDVCTGARSEQREEVKATSLETLRQMVAMGVGCTLLPALAVPDDAAAASLRMVATRPFCDPAPARTIGIVWRHHFAREQTVKGLAQLIRAHAPHGVKTEIGGM